MIARDSRTQHIIPLPLRERVARTQCVTGEGSLRIYNCELHSTPHPPFGHLLPQGEKDDAWRMCK
jgi:hypothetical protein